LAGKFVLGFPSSGQWFTDIQATNTSGVKKNTATTAAVGAA
jgi:hypothetical protein